jgi:hypothetical protein
MAISLESLKRRVVPKPPIIVLYGVRGVGKTTLAAGAPDPVLLRIEDGLGMLDVPHWEIDTFQDVMEAIGALYAEPNDFKTVIIDSLDWLEPIIFAETCRQNQWESIETPGYGKGYEMALRAWREFLGGMRALRDERNKTIVMLAHEKIKTFNSPDVDPYDRYQLKLHDKSAALIGEAADIVAFMNYRVSVRKIDPKDKNSPVRGVGGGQRLLYLEERPAWQAKNRFQMPAQIDIPSTSDPAEAWAAFANHIPTGA